MEKWAEEALKETGRAKAVVMLGRDQAGNEGGDLKKANGRQKKRGDVPRACAVEVPAMEAQPVAAGAKTLLG